MSSSEDKNTHFVNLVGLHYHTALLEAVGWDESVLRELTKYTSDFLSKKIEENTIQPNDIKILLDHIESEWGYSAKESMKGLIKFEAFNLNLLNTRSEDVN